MTAAEYQPIRERCWLPAGSLFGRDADPLPAALVRPAPRV